MPGVQGARVCNTLFAYGGYDFNPDIDYCLFFAPGRFQRVCACRLSLPPLRDLCVLSVKIERTGLRGRSAISAI